MPLGVFIVSGTIDSGETASAPGEPAGQGDTCPRCGTALFGEHCKLVCSNCGYTESCEDIFPMRNYRSDSTVGPAAGAEID